MHGLEAQYSEQIDFIYLDIDDPATEPFKAQLGYRVQPHLFVLDGQGQIRAQYLGYIDRATLEAALLEVIGGG